MRPLTAQQIVRVWERGRGRHALDRALLTLASASPATGWPELAALSVGRRNARLFALRGQTFGFALRASAACPACGCRLEFSADSRELTGARRPAGDGAGQSLSVGGVEVTFRPLDSRDLAAAARLGSAAEARARLIEGCLLSARDGARELRASELSDEAVAALAERVAEADPEAELFLSLDCPDCAHGWSMLFDIASFFWKEITSEAKRLLREVHTLASAYGWSERDVLAMSAARRQLYMEMTS